MKPLISEVQDADALQELGRASVQIIHDLKNQINGLKLYATFLRKRIETNGRPADELETINKLIAGLERAAADMTMLVRFGRPLELRRQPRADLLKALTVAAEGVSVQQDASLYQGEFDLQALADAFKNITVGARTLSDKIEPGTVEIRVRHEENGNTPMAVIEWRGIKNKGATNLFHSFAGGDGLRLAFAAKVIKAHGGDVEQETDILRARLPLSRV